MLEPELDLKPEVRAFLASSPAKLADASIGFPERRLLFRECLIARCREPEDVLMVEDVSAGGVPARLYRSSGDARDAFVWFHGGGWFMGDVDGYDHVTRALANRAGCAVVSVDYRLAPEHRFPAALDDCWIATQWAADRFDRVAAGGDSAGGNLAAAVALRAREQRLQLALQLLVYPVLVWHAEGDVVETWDSYVPDRALRFHQETSPLRAATLAGLASTLLITAEHDGFRTEGLDYVRRLEEEGVPVEVIDYEGQVHGFYSAFDAMEEGLDAVARSGAAIRQAFARA